jgi:hypothetical protein
VGAKRLAGSHWLLLRLAGSAPDDLVSQCRRWLGEGRALDVGRAVTYAVLSQHLAMIDADVDLLAELLAADGADTSALSMVDTADTHAMPLYGFAPTRARADVDVGVAADSMPGELVTQASPEDDIDRAALASVDLRPEVRALWRAWRYPGDGAPWPPPRRVFVVETDAEADLVAVTAGVQHLMEAAGEAHPQVEVYPIGADLPGYQQLARLYGALLWAREPDPGIQVAAVFDSVGTGGPKMEPDHPVIAANEMAPLLSYLRGGEQLIVTAGRMDDVVETSRRGAVPVSWLTDGRWIWCEASIYYLERYRLAPDPLLLADVRARGYQRPQVDGAALFRALAAIQGHSEEQLVWVHGT